LSKKHLLIAKRSPTKRALDAGDSAASRVESPLSRFFYTQSGLRQSPSASNANRWHAPCRITFKSSLMPYLRFFMKSKEHSKASLLNDNISTLILLFLLIYRLFDQYLPGWVFGSNIPHEYFYWYGGIVYILIAAIIWLNRHKLPLLNIDRPFIFFLIIGGLFYMFHITPDIGIFVGVATVFIFWAYKNNHLVLKNETKYPPEIIPLILTSVLLVLLPDLLFNPAFKNSINFQSVFAILASTFQTELILIAFEEVIFRGVLWEYLCGLGVKERNVFFIQAFLFWIAHNRFILVGHSYFYFWVTTPLISLLLGLIAWRSKSLTPSTTTHFLLNSTIGFINKVV